MKKGQYFGEKSLFIKEYSEFSAVVVEDATLYTLNKIEFNSLVDVSIRMFLLDKMKAA